MRRDLSFSMKTERKISMKLRSINLNDAQESTNINLLDRMKTIQDLRTEFGNEKEALKRTHTERKMDLKYPAIQLGNPKEQLKSR